MDGLERELEQLKGYLAELRAERTAAKEKDQREAWTKYTAISVVFVAVLAAVATQWGGKFSTRALTALNDATYAQSRASDQWGYYQAKSIKQSLFEISLDQGEVLGSDNRAAALRNKVTKYEQEKAEIKEQASKLEEERDQARQAAHISSGKGAGMSLAISVFQIAIAVASISMIVKKKQFWYASMALAGVATLQMIHAWLA